MLSRIFIILVLLLIYSNDLFSLTGDEVVKRLKERMSNISTMEGRLSISYQTGDTFLGNFKYRFPGKIYISFINPPGKFIVSNGKKLWAYDSSSEICGIQELDTGEKDKSGKDKSGVDNIPKLNKGLEYYLNAYTSTLISAGSSGYSIELKRENRKFYMIILYLDTTFLLVKASFFSEDNDGFLLDLSEVKIGGRIIPGFFDFNVPANAQVVKNPLDIR